MADERTGCIPKCERACVLKHSRWKHVSIYSLYEHVIAYIFLCSHHQQSGPQSSASLSGTHSSGFLCCHLCKSQLSRGFFNPDRDAEPSTSACPPSPLPLSLLQAPLALTSPRSVKTCKNLLSRSLPHTAMPNHTGKKKKKKETGSKHHRVWINLSKKHNTGRREEEYRTYFSCSPSTLKGDTFSMKHCRANTLGFEVMHK